MSSPRDQSLTCHLRRRDVVLAAGGAGAAALLCSRSSLAQGPIERLGEYLKGDLKELKDDVKSEAAKLLAMELYVYGFPLVIMDLAVATQLTGFLLWPAVVLHATFAVLVASIWLRRSHIGIG